MKTIKTSKNTELPLINLKGKDYLMVAYRLQWLSDDYPSYVIDTQHLLLTEDSTTTKATVTILNESGQMIRRATATKTETKSDFKDHTEKSETAAIGRALAMLGLGTSAALADLDEGERLADSPLEVPAKQVKTFNSLAKAKKVAEAEEETEKETVSTQTARKPASFSARLKRSNLG